MAKVWWLNSSLRLVSSHTQRCFILMCKTKYCILMAPRRQWYLTDQWRHVPSTITFQYTNRKIKLLNYKSMENVADLHGILAVKTLYIWVCKKYIGNSSMCKLHDIFQYHGRITLGSITMVECTLFWVLSNHGTDWLTCISRRVASPQEYLQQ